MMVMMISKVTLCYSGTIWELKEWLFLTYLSYIHARCFVLMFLYMKSWVS